MKAIILAGGKGKRLMSEVYDLPKALRSVNGKAMLDYVLESTQFCDEILIVVGYKKNVIIEHTKKKYTYIYQNKQLGTGHATLCALPALVDYDGPILVAFGDMPLFKKSTYKDMFEIHNENKADCTILTSVISDGEPLPKYGRILRNQNNEFEKVKEDKDCNEIEKQVREVNVGVLVCDSKKMFECLKEVGNNNNQNEYYLTELPEIMKNKKYKVITHTLYNSDEIYGANTIEDLNLVEKILKERTADD